MPIDHLPPRLRPWAEKIRSFLMTDATILLILGLECITRGVAYLDQPPPGHPSERWLSLSAWAVIWVAVGVACVASSSRHEGMAANASLSVAVGLNLLWSGSLATTSLTDHGPNGWGGAGIYGAVAVLSLWAVWRGNRDEIRVREVVHD